MTIMIGAHAEVAGLVEDLEVAVLVAMTIVEVVALADLEAAVAALMAVVPVAVGNEIEQNYIYSKLQQEKYFNLLINNILQDELIRNLNYSPRLVLKSKSIVFIIRLHKS